MKRCSATDFAFGPDPAFMRFNDMSGNCQAQTGSMLSFGLLVLALVEVLENILDLYCRNTGAIVRDSYFNCVGLPLIVLHSKGFHPNLASHRRKPQSIAQKIIQDLLNP